jgi:hypothetical protein
MRNITSKEFGKYMPAFFHISIDTDQDLHDLNSLTKEASLTFIHEYTHFLQDITTTWGLRYIAHVVEVISNYVQTIKNTQGNTFEIPLFVDYNEVTMTNRDLVSIYLGTSEPLGFSFNSIVQIDEVKNELIDGFEHVKTIEVKVEHTLTGNKGSFEFGATCVKENQAHLIESILAGKIADAPRVPYKSVEVVCGFIYPRILSNPLNIIALCDVALSTTSPGYMLVKILKEMHKRGYIPKSPRKIYEFVSRYKFGYEDERVNFITLFNRSSHHAERNLQIYFEDDYYHPIKQWITTSMEYGRTLRNKGFTFLDLAENPEIFARLVGELGTPIISNNQNKHWSFHPKTNSEDQASLFIAIGEVYSVLDGEKTQCALKSHCAGRPDGDITNKDCDVAPWERIKLPMLCPFAQIWKHWGLSNKTPILTHS